MAVLEALPSRNIVMQITERDWRKLLVSEGAIGGAQHPCLLSLQCRAKCPRGVRIPSL